MFSSQYFFANEQTKQTEKLLIAKELQLSKAAESIGPHVYKLNRKTTGSLRIFTIGCQGAQDAQKQVAKLMDTCAKTGCMPDLILILGDNFYDYGVDSAFHSDFDTKFQDIYANPVLTNIVNVPCFVILGNHDENLHYLGMLKSEKGVARGMHQVAYSYRGENKTELYQNDSLDLHHLPKWNMPYRYYSFIDEQTQTQIFCIDSNTYVRDYLRLLANPNDHRNQARWLAEQMQLAKKAGRQTSLALHHPPFTPGQRAYEPNDMTFYLDATEIAYAKTKLGDFNEKDAYNVLIQKALEKQALTFKTIFAAHDHAMYYYNNTSLCQITSGGGGGVLQERRSFAEQNNMGCYLKEHGFVDATFQVNPNLPVEFIFNTINGRQLKFDSTNAKAKQELSSNEQDEINTFISTINSALESYFNFLKPKHEEYKGKFSMWNVSHGDEGVTRAHTVWAIINQPKISSYNQIVVEIYEEARWKSYMTAPHENSLITHINNQIKKVYGNNQDLETLMMACKKSYGFN